MFQFTTTTVINNNVEGDGVRFSGKSGVLNVKRHNKFKKENVVAVYKRVASDPEMAEVTLDLNSLAAGFYRIALYIRLSGNNNSYYANDFVFKGKPLYIEFESKGEAGSELCDKVIKIANKYISMVYENKLLDLSNPTELGTLYSKQELERLSHFCQDHQLYLYLKEVLITFYLH